MKKTLLEFCRRGLLACGFGPLVLAAIYWILYSCGVIDELTVPQACLGITSLSVLAFIAGGMNILYQIERLPLTVAILIHGSVLYVTYLITYLINGWLKQGITPILVFSAIFAIGYLLIWITIFFVVKRDTTRLNEKLKQKQQSDSNL